MKYFLLFIVISSFCAYHVGSEPTDLNKLLEISNYYYDMYYDDDSEDIANSDSDQDSRNVVYYSDDVGDGRELEYNEDLMSQLDKGVPVNVVPRPDSAGKVEFENIIIYLDETGLNSTSYRKYHWGKKRK